MELFSLIINLAAELAKLARMLVADGMRFIALLTRSPTALIADDEQSSIGSCIPAGGFG
jgi:hypothetical protein